MFHFVYNADDKRSEHPKIRSPRRLLLHRFNAELFVRVSAGVFPLSGILSMPKGVHGLGSAYSDGNFEQDDLKTFSSNCFYTNFLVAFIVNVILVKKKTNMIIHNAFNSEL